MFEFVLWCVAGMLAGYLGRWATPAKKPPPEKRPAELGHVYAVFRMGDHGAPHPSPLATGAKRKELDAYTAAWNEANPDRPAKLALVQPGVSHRFLNWISD